MNEAQPILAVGVLLAGSLLAAVAAARLRIPAVLLFLAVGMVAGSDGSGWIAFDDYSLARELGTAALALILFEGGLRTCLSEIRQVLRPALLLAIGGTILVAGITAGSAIALAGMPPKQGLLLGAVIASTDSAAVFMLLRGSSLDRRLVQTLEGEAGFNDPVALVLVLACSQWIIHPAFGLGELVVLSLRQFVIGGVCGYLVTQLAVAAWRRWNPQTKGLYPVASLAVAALAFGSADALHGSGLLAVYLSGLLLGDARLPGSAEAATFQEGAAWVAQIGVFVGFGLLVFPSHLGATAPVGIALGIIVVVVARPIATIVMTVDQGFTLAERAVLSWAGLRGAAPIVFATYPVSMHVPGARTLFDVVFCAVVVSMLLQGPTFEPMARMLGLTSPRSSASQSVAERLPERARLGTAEFVDYTVGALDGVVGRRLRDVRLPTGSRVNAILRGRHLIQPTALTRVRRGDTLKILTCIELDEFVTLPVGVDEPESPSPAKGMPFRAAMSPALARPLRETSQDPSDPEIVAGRVVVERLRASQDRSSALVRLEDGNCAVTTGGVFVAEPEALRTYALMRAASAVEEFEAVWWEEVAAVLRPTRQQAPGR